MGAVGSFFDPQPCKRGYDPSRRQQANFLRKKLEGEKFEKSESEEV